MAGEAVALVLIAYLVTYAIHSTVLLALALLIARRLAPGALRSRELLLKTAVLGGLLSAALQLGLGIEPPAGRIALHAAPASSPDLAPATWGGSPGRARSAPLPVERDTRGIGAEQAGLPAPMVLALGVARATAGSLRPLEAAVDARERAGGRAGAPAGPGAVLRVPSALAAELSGTWTRAAVLGWSLSGLAGAVLFALGLRRLRRDLSGRRELREGALFETLEALRRRARVKPRVRLYLAPRIAAPLSMGWMRPAVCLPPRVVSELAEEEQRAVLAHELAHVARRDPPWLFLLWLVETVFFFQPLNRVARRELAATFELAADAWAARATGERLALASCLARIAGWVLGAPPPRAHRAWTAAMADGLDPRRPRSRLAVRIERLLASDSGPEPAAPRRVEALLAASVLSTLTLVVPGASAAPPGAIQAGAAHPGERGALEPAPLAPPAAERSEPGPDGLAEPLFGELDRALDGIEAEIAALGAELSVSAPDQRFDETLGELQRRARRLRERRERMQVLLEAVLAEEASLVEQPESTARTLRDRSELSERSERVDIVPEKGSGR